MIDRRGPLVSARDAVARGERSAEAITREALDAIARHEPVLNAYTAVGAEALRNSGPMVNLSESLARVPGLVVANRNNYAQDLQISSRGFGARAGFGVRGLRLYADGIPASMPDGQGQVAHFDTSSRIPGEKFCFALNTVLPPDIRVSASEETRPDFHARIYGYFETLSTGYAAIRRRHGLRVADSFMCHHCAYMQLECDIDRVEEVAA